MFLPHNVCRSRCLLWAALGAMLSGIGSAVQSMNTDPAIANHSPALRQTEGQTHTSVKPALLRYRLTDLGTLGGSAYGMAINNQGQILGTSSRPGTSGLIFLWGNGKIHEIGTLPGRIASSAGGINSKGHIVGYADKEGNSPLDKPNTALIWRSGKLERLFPDSRSSRANSINDHDVVVGSMDEQAIEHAFLWRNGQVTDLGTLWGGGSSIAMAVNAHDQVVGRSVYEGVTHAFLWEKGKMRDLGTLGGKQQSEALGINDLGQVVGGAETASGQYHAFMWEKGTMHDLGSPGAGLCTAYKINRKGQVIGEWWPQDTGDQGSRALLWVGGIRYDLNDLVPPDAGWVLMDAGNINDQGQIVGTGKLNGSYRAFLLTPISR